MGPCAEVSRWTRPRGEDAFVPRRATLGGFAKEVSARDGVCLRDLEPLTTLLVRTQNSVYRLTVIEGSSVLVQGGKFFPQATVARFSGSGFGGSMLKLAWVGMGLCMEICPDGQRIVTSPVRTLRLEDDVSPSVPQ